jgi:AcrR family transcriptional regulator
MSPSKTEAKSRPRTPATARSPKNGRQEQSAARRDAILAAALDEFSARGFAATRLEDIAKRAGVAKGTIYLHFADKEKLFEEIIRSMVVPFVATIESMPPVDLPIRVILNNLIELFVREVYGTRRRDVLRLVIAEVPRFPALADFYYKNVVERAIGALRGIIGRAVARGELSDDTLVRYPQLIVAPGLMAIVWNALFERQAPLDIAPLMRAQLDFVLGKEKLP